MKCQDSDPDPLPNRSSMSAPVMWPPWGSWENEHPGWAGGVGSEVVTADRLVDKEEVSTTSPGRFFTTSREKEREPVGGAGGGFGVWV